MVRAGLGAILIDMDRGTKSTASEGRYLLVRAGDSRCAIPARGVRRVVRNLPCHPFPGGKPHFVGFSQFGGEPLAVIDLHTLITGEEARIHHGATVILGHGSRGGRTVIGLAVDEAFRVVVFADQGTKTRSGGVVEGTRTLDGDSVTVLETSLLLDDEPTGTEAPLG